MGRKRREKIRSKTDAAARPAKAAPATVNGIHFLRASAVAVAVFALLFSFVAVTAISQKSNTVDEPVHVLAGYSYLKWGDFRLNPEHPPLAKMWAALPLLARGRTLRLDTQSARYFAGVITAANLQEFFPGTPVETVFFIAKLQMVFVAIALGIFVFAWSKELFGFQAAVAALFFYALDPNILAHSQLVHTDIAFTAFSFICIYFLWRAFRELTWSNLLLFYLFCGLAAATKHSFALMLPIGAALALVKIFSSQLLPCAIGKTRSITGHTGKAIVLAGVFVGALLGSYLLLWASYGFRFDAVPAPGLPLSSAALMPEQPILRIWVSFLLEFHLFPEAWINGQLFNLKHLARTAYLLGEVSDTGFWAYFPVAFAVKTPLPTLLLLAAAVYLLARKRIDRMTGLFLLIPVVVYFSLAVASRMNIGLRHILPIYPFLFVLIGGTAWELWKESSRLKKAGLTLIALWYLGSAFFIYPHHLAYFNELAGGPGNGYKILVDSNLDWGQDLKGLKTFMEDRGIKKIYLSYFGTADPCSYRIDFVYLASPPPRPAPCGQENDGGGAPGFIAVSATGRFLVKNYYEWLQHYRPIAQIGYSIFVYDIRGNAAAHKNLGIVYLKSGLLKEARREFELAGEPLAKKDIAELDLGNEAAVYVNLGAVFFEDGMLDEAIVLFQRAIRLKPDDSDAHSNLGGVYLSKNRVDDAIKELDSAVRINPNNAEAHNNLGSAYLRKARHELAIAEYKEALRLRPDFEDAQKNLQTLLPARPPTGKPSP
jgi:tetratricopeptide (TPR) repeat protein